MSPRRAIKAKSILNDFLSGMTESDLMAKYRLSSDDLARVRRYVLDDRGVAVKGIVDDIRNGLTDFELMERYELIPSELRSVLDDLTALGALRKGELRERSPFYDNPANRTRSRRWSRTYVRIWLPVYDSETWMMRGLVRDLYDNGFRAASLRSDIGEGSNLAIRAELVGDVKAFRFKAECRWVRKKEKESAEYYLAGFEITEITDEALRELRKLIEILKDGA